MSGFLHAGNVGSTIAPARQTAFERFGRDADAGNRQAVAAADCQKSKSPGHQSGEAPLDQRRQALAQVEQGGGYEENSNPVIAVERQGRFASSHSRHHRQLAGVGGAFLGSADRHKLCR